MSYQDCQRIEKNGGLTHLRERHKLTPAQLTVIRALIQADREGYCFPTQETIAFESGLPVETVRRAARALTDKGLITREKQPYIDKRGRLRPGKIYHYLFREEVIEAIVNGRTLPDTVQNDHNRETPPDTVQNDHNREQDLFDTAQNDRNRERNLPDTVQNDHNREQALPDTMQNDHNREQALPDTVQNDRNRENLPDSDQNDHHIVIKMNGSSDQNDQYVPIKMISQKLEVKKETKREIRNDTEQMVKTSTAKVNGASSQETAAEPEPRPPGRDRFMQIARVLSASQYNALVRRVQAIIDREPDRSAKDAIVHQCCDRIEEFLLRGEEPTAALDAVGSAYSALFGEAAGALRLNEAQGGQLASD